MDQMIATVPDMLAAPAKKSHYRRSQDTKIPQPIEGFVNGVMRHHKLCNCRV